jgi:hypothetical protein
MVSASSPSGRAAGCPDEGHVGRTGPYLLDQPIGVAFHQRDLDAGMREVERAQGVEQRGDGAGRHHPDHDPAGEQPRHVVHRLADRGRGRERGPGVRQGRRPSRRQRSHPARPVDQRRAEIPLKLADLRADPGLADVHPLRGPGEVRVLGDRDEVLQLPQFHSQ